MDIAFLYINQVSEVIHGRPLPDMTHATRDGQMQNKWTVQKKTVKQCLGSWEETGAYGKIIRHGGEQANSIHTIIRIQNYTLYLSAVKKKY